MWYAEALKEKGVAAYFRWKLFGGRPYTDYAIFPRRYWDNKALDFTKKIFDYCFIGGLATDPKTLQSRQWLTQFIADHFTSKSYLQFTDKETRRRHREMGPFDYTIRRKGFVPKEVPVKQRNHFDANYFSTMAKSKFALCPAGDAPWSMRFYEALMCKAIPVVERAEHTFRTRQEARLGYRYFLPGEQHEYHEDWAEHNYQLFLKYHTLVNR